MCYLPQYGSTIIHVILDRFWYKACFYVTAFDRQRLVGLVNVAWDGGVLGFILDATVQSSDQRRRIGTELMKQAAEAAFVRGLEWFHVDFDAQYETLYRHCSF